MILLTNKALDSFTQWYEEKRLREKRINSLTEFKALSISEQFGPYQDWAESVGYELLTMRWRGKYSCSIYKDNGDQISGQIGKEKLTKDPDEARRTTLNKFNILFNEL